MHTTWRFIGSAALVGARPVRSGVPLACLVAGVSLPGVVTVLEARRPLASNYSGR